MVSAWTQEKSKPSCSRVSETSSELSQLNWGCPSCLLTGPTAYAGLFWSPKVDLNQRDCQLFPQEKKKTKVYLRSAENCNSGSASLASHIQVPPPHGKGRRLLRGGEGRQEAAGNRTHCFLSTESSSGKVGLWLHFLPGSAAVPGCESALFWSPDSVLLRFLFISFLE